MGGLCIGIVEDELLTAESIAIHLEKMGHKPLGPFTSFDAVLAGLADQRPDLFLLDIRLKGKRTGLDVAHLLKIKYKIPFLFLTSQTDSKTVNQAVAASPMGYITKPFSFEDLFIGIELTKAKLNLGLSSQRKISIRNGYETEWILADDILYLEADRSYVTLYLVDGTRILRQSLGKFLKTFENGDMVRIHRSYAVNPRKVESITMRSVTIRGHQIPLGKQYREQFQQYLIHLNG